MMLHGKIKNIERSQLAGAMRNCATVQSSFAIVPIKVSVACVSLSQFNGSIFQLTFRGRAVASVESNRAACADDISIIFDRRSNETFLKPFQSITHMCVDIYRMFRRLNFPLIGFSVWSFVESHKRADRCGRLIKKVNITVITGADYLWCYMSHFHYKMLINVSLLLAGAANS